MLRQVIAEYPETEYADESRRWLGLPVPKRAKKKPEVKPETTATVPPTGGKEPAKQPGIEPPPIPPESLPSDTGEMAVTREPGMFPPGQRGPGRFPTGTVPERGLSPESGKAGTALPHSKGESPVARPDTGAKGQGPGVGAQGSKDTVRTPPVPVPKADTAGQARPAEKPEPAKPAARIQLEIAHFATDSWQIQAADSARLRADAESLKAHSDVKIVIVGHCDPRASERYNRELGLKRAHAVKGFLVAAGVDADRVSVRSDGEKRPISTKPDEFWLDRRVEFECR
jgi:outer membrane protein OmpA-like peptidoglycan-associated protein